MPHTIPKPDAGTYPDSSHYDFWATLEYDAPHDDAKNALNAYIGELDAILGENGDMVYLDGTDLWHDYELTRKGDTWYYKGTVGNDETLGQFEGESGWSAGFE